MWIGITLAVLVQVRWRALEASQKELSRRLAKSVESEAILKIRAAAVIENSHRKPNLSKATREMKIDSLKRKAINTRKVGKR